MVKHLPYGRKRGLFIAFEGIDGCGKTTQAKMLADYIFSLSKYNPVLLTREPYRDQDIRKILQQEEDPYSQGLKLAKMFVNDRRRHVKELIIPNLKRGVYIISDRYSWSTLAYQQTQGISLKELIKMHTKLPIPDLIFLVDLPVKTALKRIRKDKVRKAEQKFEKNEEFINKLRSNYWNLIGLKNHKVILIRGDINGQTSAKQIFNKQIKPAFDELYNAKVAKP